jgi:endonuclease YncB( thermonuclease family)
VLIAVEKPHDETLRVPVLKIFDGDGFLTRLSYPGQLGERDLVVRFGFTDAPEMDQPGGKEAKAFLEALIGNRWVDLVVLLKMDTGGIVDRYGRMVCVPYLCEPIHSERFRNIELEMVLNGWSWVLDRYGPDERYFEALEDAQRNRRGIWASEGNVHPWEHKRRKYHEGFNRSQQLRRSEVDPASVESRCPLECGGHLVERNGKFGLFWGCSNFPGCRYSRSS